MKRIALLLLLASSAFADDFVTVPRVLTNLTRATVHWAGVGSSTLTEPVVTIDGNHVQIDFAHGGCVINACMYYGTVELPVLPAGTYQFAMTQGGGTLVEKTVEVYDVTSLPLFPAGAPVDPRDWYIAMPDYPRINLSFPSSSGAELVTASGFFAPRGTRDGAVDVGFALDGSRSHVRGVARNAFIYTAGDPCRDERIWESVLVPVYYNGPGAFGSYWVTDVSTTGPPLAAKDCQGAFGYITPSRTTGAYFMRVPRTGAHLLRYQVRIRETLGNSLPVDIPVLREWEWLDGLTTIELPPPSPKRRATLRLYAPDDVAKTILVRTATKTAQVDLQNLGDDAPRFATLDLTGFSGTLTLQSLGYDYARIRYWALLTVTDNETQQVFVYPAPKAR